MEMRDLLKNKFILILIIFLSIFLIYILAIQTSNLTAAVTKNNVFERHVKVDKSQNHASDDVKYMLKCRKTIKTAWKFSINDAGNCNQCPENYNFLRCEYDMMGFFKRAVCVKDYKTPCSSNPTCGNDIQISKRPCGKVETYIYGNGQIVAKMVVNEDDE